MLEMKYSEKEKTDGLYNEVKEILLNNKDIQEFSYTKKQHHLYEESEYPGISKDYYNEYGKVVFVNTYDEVIQIEIDRWHPRKCNGYSGLNNNPVMHAKIIKLENNQEEILWELEVESGTMHYKAYVSSLDIPKNILNADLDATIKYFEELEKEKNNVISLHL